MTITTVRELRRVCDSVAQARLRSLSEATHLRSMVPGISELPDVVVSRSAHDICVANCLQLR
jgi:hypothetical protein